MSASSRKAQRALVLAGLFVVVALSGPLHAQTGEPSQLGPMVSDDEPESGREGDDGPDETGDGEAAGGPDEIQVDRLGTMETATMGILDPDKAGLGPDMWRKTPRRAVVRLLQRVPADLGSPALRSLARRLLLSSSAPPERRQAPEGKTPGLLRVRVDRLMAMGHYADTADLLRVVSRRDQSDALNRRRAAAALLTGKVDEACKIVDTAVDQSDAVYWQEALAVCHVARGELDQADLTVSLMRELADRPTRFLAVYDAVTAGGDLPEGPYPVLANAMLVHGDRAIPARLVDRSKPGLCRVVAGHGASAATVRALAAECAVAADMLDPEALRQRYRAVDVPDALVTAARQRQLILAPPAAGRLSPVAVRALRYQAAEAAETPVRRARLLDALLTGVRGDRYRAIARAVVPQLRADGPRPDLIWFAGTAGRALYAADAPDVAAQWLKLAREEAVITPDAAKALTALWPYARLSGSTAVPMNGGLAAWRGAQPGDDARVAVQESLLRAAFHGVNERDPRSWLAIAAESPGRARSAPPAPLIYALRDAGVGERAGEAALLAVVGLARTGMAEVHPMMLQTALTALRQVGLSAAARRLAIEAALANGI